MYKFINSNAHKDERQTIRLHERFIKMKVLAMYVPKHSSKDTPAQGLSMQLNG
jgi:hypothetical protein